MEAVMEGETKKTAARLAGAAVREAKGAREAKAKREAREARAMREARATRAMKEVGATRTAMAMGKRASRPAILGEASSKMNAESDRASRHRTSEAQGQVTDIGWVAGDD